MTKRNRSSSSNRGISEKEIVINKLKQDNFLKTQSIINSLGESTGDIDFGNSHYYRDNKSLTGYKKEEIDEEINKVEVTEEIDDTNQCLLKTTKDKMEIYLRDYDSEMEKYYKAKTQFNNSIIWLVNLIISSISLTYASATQGIEDLALNIIVEEHLLSIIIIFFTILLYLATAVTFIILLVLLVRRCRTKRPDSMNVIERIKNLKSYKIK